MLLIAAAGCCCWLLLMVDAVDCCCWLLLLVDAADCCCWLLLLVAAQKFFDYFQNIVDDLRLRQLCRRKSLWIFSGADEKSLNISGLLVKSLWIFPEYSWWFAAKTNLRAKKSLNIFGCWWKVFEYFRVVGEKSLNISRILMGEKRKRGSPRGSRLESEWILWLWASYLYSIIQDGRRLSESQ